MGEGTVCKPGPVGPARVKAGALLAPQGGSISARPPGGSPAARRAASGQRPTYLSCPVLAVTSPGTRRAELHVVIPRRAVFHRSTDHYQERSLRSRPADGASAALDTDHARVKTGSGQDGGGALGMPEIRVKRALTVNRQALVPATCPIQRHPEVNRGQRRTKTMCL